MVVSATPPHVPLAFGWDALSDSGSKKGPLFIEFKMQLRPGGLLRGRGEPTAFKVKDTTGREWPLLVPVVATLTHVRKQVMDRLEALLSDKLATSEIRCGGVGSPLTPTPPPTPHALPPQLGGHGPRNLGRRGARVHALRL